MHGGWQMQALEIETRDGLRRIALDKPRLTIGRLPGNDIMLPYAQISRHHAEVRQRNDEWWISDLGSTNGLRVAGNVVHEYLMHHGDSVMLAPHIILHFVDQRVHAGVVEGSTVMLAAVEVPERTGPTIIPRHEPVVEPKSTEQIATAAAVPLPRRKMGLTAPPSTEAQSAVPQWRVAQPALKAENTAEWLVDATDEPAPPVVESHAAGDLPLQSPFALLKQGGARTPAKPKRPLLYLCPDLRRANRAR